MTLMNKYQSRVFGEEASSYYVGSGLGFITFTSTSV